MQVKDKALEDILNVKEQVVLDKFWTPDTADRCSGLIVKSLLGYISPGILRFLTELNFVPGKKN